MEGVVIPEIGCFKEVPYEKNIPLELVLESRYQ
jgi:hypothetical protein